MKKYQLAIIQTIFAVFLISTIANSAPNIDGLNMDQNEWTGGSFGSDPSDDAVGGSTYEIYGLGLYISDTTLYWGLKTKFEVNYMEPNAYPGHIAIDFLESAVVGGNTDGPDFAFRFNVPDWNQERVPEGVYNAEFDVIKTDDNSYWDNRDGGDEPYKLRRGTVIADNITEAKYGRSGGTLTNPDINILEGAVDLNLLTAQLDTIDTVNGYDVKIYWNMSCGNDVAWHMFRVPGTPDYVIPEPSTFMLFGLGLLGLSAVGRKRRTKEKI